MQTAWLPTIRAVVALHRGDANAAIELLRDMGSYELTFNSRPIYVRGLAYLSLHDPGAAANEFKKVTSHPGRSGNDPVGQLARLGLARAYAMQGDKENARKWYQEFLWLWKDADADLLSLRQAKEEYERLN